MDPCGSLLPHSSNADLPPFCAILACTLVVEAKSELSADLRRWWSMGAGSSIFPFSEVPAIG